ncbi:MAG: hypothetical protein U5O39_12590 [Gammaproteobacteria bacterium]|nr:hypothetical protein [Gammaproteobacteria bacterium]
MTTMGSGVMISATDVVRRIAVLEDQFARVIALGDDADEPAIVDDGKRTDVTIRHLADRVDDHVAGRDRPHLIALRFQHFFDCTHPENLLLWSRNRSSYS